MSIRSIAIISVLLLAAIGGRLQHVTLPAWAWIVWGTLLIIAIAAWYIVTGAVSLVIRKTVMIIPLSQKIETTSDSWKLIPVLGL